MLTFSLVGKITLKVSVVDRVVNDLATSYSMVTLKVFIFSDIAADKNSVAIY